MYKSQYSKAFWGYDVGIFFNETGFSVVNSGKQLRQQYNWAAIYFCSLL